MLYSNRFLRRIQKWLVRKKDDREFLAQKEMLEEILKVFTLARKRERPGYGYLTLTLSKEAVSYLEDFVKNCLEELKIQEFLRSLPTKPYNPS